jgi:hypothetical protein
MVGHLGLTNGGKHRDRFRNHGSFVLPHKTRKHQRRQHSQNDHHHQKFGKRKPTSFLDHNQPPDDFLRDILPEREDVAKNLPTPNFQPL